MGKEKNEDTKWLIRFFIAITLFCISLLYLYLAKVTTFPFIHMGESLDISPDIIAWIFLGLGVIGLLLVSIFGLLAVYIK